MTCTVPNKSRLSCRGTAFLEVLLVSSIIAGVIISVTLGLHALGQNSIAGEAGIRSAYVQTAALMTSLEKDFAYADQVIVLKDKKVELATPPTAPAVNTPWTNAGYFNAPASFAQKSTPSATNDNYSQALDANPAIVVTATPNAHSELHFLKAGKIIAVLTVSDNTTGAERSLIFTRYTPAGVGQSVRTALRTGTGATATFDPGTGWVSEDVLVRPSSGVQTGVVTVQMPNVTAYSSVWNDDNSDGEWSDSEMKGLSVSEGVGAVAPASRLNLHTKELGNIKNLKLVRLKAKI